MNLGMLLLVALCVIVQVMGSVTMYSYINSETTNNIEYHCFTSDSNGQPNYVRGTYGKRGYFEGYVTASGSSYVANVNFYEVTVGTDSLTPSSGSAQLTYSSEFTEVDGYFWNSGESDIFMSRAEWGIEDVCEDCDNTDDTGNELSGDDLYGARCLYKSTYASGSSALGYLSKGKTNDLIFGTSGNYNVFNRVGAGSSFTAGHMVGGYQYTYSDAECADLGTRCTDYGHLELGHYGINSISPNLMSSELLVSTWTAVEGPYTGSSGSSVYAIAYDEDIDSYVLMGYFCNTGVADSGSLELTDCSYEEYSTSSLEYSASTSKTLMEPYEELGKTESGPVQRLKAFNGAAFRQSPNFLRSF